MSRDCLLTTGLRPRQSVIAGHSQQLKQNQNKNKCKTKQISIGLSSSFQFSNFCNTKTEIMNMTNQNANKTMNQLVLGPNKCEWHQAQETAYKHFANITDLVSVLTGFQSGKTKVNYFINSSENCSDYCLKNQRVCSECFEF